MEVFGGKTNTNGLISPFTGKPGWIVYKDNEGRYVGDCKETGARIVAEDEAGLEIAYNLAVSRREGLGEVGPTITTG